MYAGGVILLDKIMHRELGQCALWLFHVFSLLLRSDGWSRRGRESLTPEPRTLSNKILFAEGML